MVISAEQALAWIAINHAWVEYKVFEGKRTWLILAFGFRVTNDSLPAAVIDIIERLTKAAEVPSG